MGIVRTPQPAPGRLRATHACHPAGRRRIWRSTASRCGLLIIPQVWSVLRSCSP